jgi:hypothetical protein
MIMGHLAPAAPSARGPKTILVRASLTRRCAVGRGQPACSGAVTDLPEARAVTTQYDRHEVECSCGRVHAAGALPGAAGAPGTVTYGLNFQAWCVFRTPEPAPCSGQCS